MYMADPDILTTRPTLSYPILVGGNYMAWFCMDAIYFLDSFAILDSIAGLIPRGTWPRHRPTECLREFSYKIPFDHFLSLVHKAPKVIKVLPLEDKQVKPQPVPATALHPEDLALNEEIIESIRQDRIDLSGILSAEVRLTAK